MRCPLVGWTPPKDAIGSDALLRSNEPSVQYAFDPDSKFVGAVGEKLPRSNMSAGVKKGRGGGSLSTPREATNVLPEFVERSIGTCRDAFPVGRTADQTGHITCLKSR
jgi:hypothetical protein